MTQNNAIYYRTYLQMRKKTKTYKRFVIDKIKMTFITEPFYNGEKKINKRFVVDKKNAIY